MSQPQLPLPPFRVDGMLSANDKLITSHSVTLQWTLHKSRPLHRVERQEVGEPWETIALVPGPVFVDPDCDAATVYVYRVTADMNGIVPDLFDMIRVTTRPRLQYPDARAFFDKFLQPTFLRTDNGESGVDWCIEWHRHPEAQLVVRELWRSFEAHWPKLGINEPGSDLAQWLVHIAYPLLDRLWTKQLVFKGCHWDLHNPSNRMMGTEN